MCLCVIIALIITVPIFIFEVDGRSSRGYNGLTVTMDDYEALGVATFNKADKPTSSVNVAFASNGRKTRKRNLMAGRDKEGVVEEVVFENSHGKSIEQLFDITAMVSFNQFTFFQTTTKSTESFNNYSEIRVERGGEAYVLDHATGEIYSLNRYFGQEFYIPLMVDLNHDFYEWFESDTAVYLNVEAKGRKNNNYGSYNIYRFKSVNGALKINQVTNNISNPDKYSFFFKYVDKHDNIFVTITPGKSEPGPITEVYDAFLRVGKRGKWEIHKLEGRKGVTINSIYQGTEWKFGGRAKDGQVYLVDGIRYIDEKGKIQYASEHADLTFLARRSLGERDGSLYYIDIHFYWEGSGAVNRYDVYKYTPINDSGFTVEQTVSIKARSIYNNMPAIMGDMICVIDGMALFSRAVAGYNLCTGERTVFSLGENIHTVYQISPGFVSAVSFIAYNNTDYQPFGGFILPSGEIVQYMTSDYNILYLRYF